MATFAIQLVLNYKMRTLTIIAATAMCVACNAQNAPYWRANSNLALFELLAKSDIKACNNLKWRNEESNGRPHEYTVRCTKSGVDWVQYRARPVWGEIAGPEHGVRDPHPELSATISWQQVVAEHDTRQKRLAELRANPTTPSYSTAEAANPSDLAQAETFLRDLPPACSRSTKYVGNDGAVNIRVKCSGNNQSIDGRVVVRNGIITKVE